MDPVARTVTAHNPDREAASFAEGVGLPNGAVLPESESGVLELFA